MAKIAGVHRYVIQAVRRAASGADLEPVCDGIAEIWFDSLAVVQDAAESREGQAAAADLPKFCSPESGTVVVEEIAVVVGQAETPSPIRGVCVNRYNS